MQDAQLIEAVQEVEWHGDTFCLYDLGFAWGSGKNEIKVHLQRVKAEAKAPDNIVVPRAKGLFCALFVRAPTSAKSLLQATPPAYASLQSASRRERPSGTKWGDRVFSEHITTHNVVNLWETCQQTHTAAIGFVLPDLGLEPHLLQNVPRVIYGTHLSFCGDTHPDHSGQRIRSRQLSLVRQHARRLLLAIRHLRRYRRDAQFLEI